jgi:immune inhibitor A
MKYIAGLIGLAVAVSFAGSAGSMPIRPDMLEHLIAEGRAGEVAGEMALEPPALLRSPASLAQDTIHCVVILVNFGDVGADTLTHSLDWFRDILFSAENPSSMRSYFLANSYGKMDVTGDIYGWFGVPETMAYYADNRRGMGSYPQNAQKMVEDAVDAANAFIDFSRYDNDGADRIPNSGDDDGVVDFLIVVHAGRGYEWTLDPGDIHSHAARIHPRPVDGVYAVNYATEPEDARVGTFAHELGHLLGLPDLYDVTLNSFGLGMASLMAYGSWGGGDASRPVGLDAWCRMKLGFLDPVVQAENQTSYDLSCIEDGPDALILWNDGRPGPQYFMVENRRAKSYDSYLSLFGEGLYIYHVDERAEDNSGEGRHLISLEQADGRFDLEKLRSWGFGSDKGDPYPGTSDNRDFSWNTLPDNYSYEGTPTQVSVRGISDPGDTMTFDVEVNSPVLLYERHRVDDSAGDGDEEPDPGETILLNVFLRNFGIGCTDLVATLESEDQYTEIETPTASLPAVGDSTLSGALTYRLYIKENIPEPHDIHLGLALRADFGSGEYLQSERFVLGVPIRPLAGWPVYLDEIIYSSPAAADLDGDGTNEVVLGCYDSHVYAWKSDGTLMPGWPVSTGGRITSTPAICDIDIDGSPEVVIGSQDGRVYVLEVDGTSTPGWPQATGGAVRSSPVLADIDDDGMVEVICGSMDGSIYAWEEDGARVPGFPVELGTGGIWMSPAAGDIDGDYVADIVAGTYGGDLYVLHGDGTPHDGWPVFIGHGCGRGSPAIADMDGDGSAEIVVSGLWSNSIYVVGAGGHVWPGWPRWAYNCSSLSAPIPADIDNDGLPEIAVSTSCGTVIAWESDGEECEAIKAQAGYPIQNCEPAFADLNGNGRLEAIVGTVANSATGIAEVQAFGAQGSLEGFPVGIRGKVWASPAISDLDGDGNAELIFATTDGVVQIWRFVGAKAAGKLEWPKSRGDVWNTGCYGFEPKGNEPLPDLMVSMDDIVITPSKPKEGENATISVLIRNVGHEAAGPFSMRIYVAGAADSLLIGDFDFEGLDAKSDTVLSMPWRVPGGEFSRVILVAVDEEDRIVERFDVNNRASRRFYLSVPDLAVEITDVSDLPAVLWDSLSVSASLVNAGEDMARGFRLAFYDSIVSDETCFASFELDSLSIGEEMSFTVKYFVGPFHNDYRRIWCVADPRDDVLEYYQSNNVVSFDVQSGIQGDVFSVPDVPPPLSLKTSRSTIVAFSTWCNCLYAVESVYPYPLVFEARGEDADVAWNSIVYASLGDIIGYDLLDSLSFVVSSGADEEAKPSVWGENIAWLAYSPGGTAIKFRAGQDTVRTVRPPSSAEIESPDVSDKYIVWAEDRGSGFDIYGYELSTGSVTAICNDAGDQKNPVVWGDLVVWVDLAHDDGDIHMADLATGERLAVADAAGSQVSPSVSGDFVVWQDSRNGNWDIYAYRLADRQEFPVCRQVDDQTCPAVTDSSVVWVDARGEYTSIRGLRFGGPRCVARVKRFDTLSQDGAIRIVLDIDEFEDQISYRIYRYPDGRQVPYGDVSHVRVGFALNEDTSFVYADTLIAETRRYYYTVGIVDGYGTESYVGPVAGSGYKRTPQALVVGSPYPNPVRQEVKLSFGLPRLTIYSDASSWPVPSEEKRGVDISVYDVRGRLVRRLVDDVMAPGYYQVSWDGRDEDRLAVSSGVYFLAVSIDGAMTSRKVILIH